MQEYKLVAIVQILNGQTRNKPFGGSMSERYSFVMMVREKWWIEFRRRLQEGKEVHSFVIRGAGPPKGTQLILFYVTNPVRAIAGYAHYIERIVGKPQDLWSRYGGESVLGSKSRYEEFIGSAAEVSFVRFTDLNVAVNPVHLSSLLMYLGLRRLSRKGFYVDKDRSDRLVSMME
jgi:predicted transcriptional regulator